MSAYGVFDDSPLTVGSSFCFLSACLLSRSTTICEKDGRTFAFIWQEEETKTKHLTIKSMTSWSNCPTLMLACCRQTIGKHYCLHLSEIITAVRGLNTGYRNTMITPFKRDTTFRDNPTTLHLLRKTWHNPYFSSAMLVETNKCLHRCGHCWEVLIQLYDDSWGYRPVCYILRTYQTCCTTWQLS